MTEAKPPTTQARARREPPSFRTVVVRRREQRAPRLMRVTCGGPELAGLRVEEPAASVRLLLPSPGSPELVIPAWDGNEFLLPDGARPTIRSLTPRRVDPKDPELDLEIVLHGGGAASTWAATVEPGAPCAIAGPGRGYTIDRGAPGFLLAGDETAIPAISQLLEALPEDTPVEVQIEIAHPDGRVDLPPHPGATVGWHELTPGGAPGDALVAALDATDIGAGSRVWVAGEAAAMQRIRRQLFSARGLSRADATVRGYWKHGRSASSDAEA
jgi:NADPH-dependent ferric siderophore reductase